MRLAGRIHSSLRQSQDDGPIPIFIVGMHRSGTTLLEQMLAGHWQIRGTGELYDFTSAMRYATDHRCNGVLVATIVARASGVGRGRATLLEHREVARDWASLLTDELSFELLERCVHRPCTAARETSSDASRSDRDLLSDLRELLGANAQL